MKKKNKLVCLIYLVPCYVGFLLHSLPGPQMLGAGKPGPPSGSPVSAQASSRSCVSARPSWRKASIGLTKDYDGNKRRTDVRAVWGCAVMGESAVETDEAKCQEYARKGTIFGAAWPRAS